MTKQNWGKDITCPKCQGQGKSFLEEGRLYFRCFTCGYYTLLKLLNLKN